MIYTLLAYHSTDVDEDTLPPVWPIDPASLVVEDPVYDVVTVPLSSIVMVTDIVLKVSIAFHVQWTIELIECIQ